MATSTAATVASRSEQRAVQRARLAAQVIQRWRDPVWSYLRLVGLPDAAAERVFTRTLAAVGVSPKLDPILRDPIRILAHASRTARLTLVWRRLRRLALRPAKVGSDLPEILERMPLGLRDALVIARLVGPSRLPRALGLDRGTAQRRLRNARLHVARRLGVAP